MVAGLRLALELMQDPDVRSLRNELFTAVYCEVAESAMASEPWLSATVATRTFGMYHPAGTCRMGDDAEAVVDPHCAVRGIQGLSVVDASVIPNPVCGATNLPVMMIAERASDLMLGRPCPT